MLGGGGDGGVFALGGEVAGDLVGHIGEAGDVHGGVLSRQCFIRINGTLPPPP